MKKNDITGQRFGKLTVIRDSGFKGVSQWICRCDCGNEVTIYGTNLMNGRSKSCGCSKKVAQGDSLTKLYQAWVRMGNEREWESYNDFKDWAIGQGYIEGCRFRRMDVTKPFSADNCKIIPIKGEN